MTIRHRAFAAIPAALAVCGLCSAGDAANAILTAVGYNFRRILTWLRILLRLILSALMAALPPQPALNPAS